MSFDRYKPWADDVVDQEDENGPKVETDATFDDTKIGAGCTKERFPYPTFNRVMNRADNQINSLTDIGMSLLGGSTRDTEVLEGRISDASFICSPRSISNVFSYGDPDLIFSQVCPAIIGGARKCICFDWYEASHTIYILDVETGIWTTTDLSAGFDAACVGIYSMCVDAEYLYAASYDETLSACRVQAFSLADWTVRDGWPAGGYNSLCDNNEEDGFIQLIIADSTRLAISDPINRLIRFIYRADGTSAGSGDGDYSSGASPICGIASNGTYVFFITGALLCSVSIATPSSGCGGAGWPYNLPFTGRYIAVGGNYIAVSSGDTEGDPQYGRISVSHTSRAAWAIHRMDRTTFGQMAFDDAGLIAASVRNGSTFMSRIPIFSTSYEGGGVPTAVTWAARSIPEYHFDFEDPTYNGIFKNIKWDGRDTWTGGTNSGAEWGGKVLRLANSRNRVY